MKNKLYTALLTPDHLEFIRDVIKLYKDHCDGDIAQGDIENMEAVEFRFHAAEQSEETPYSVLLRPEHRIFIDCTLENMEHTDGIDVCRNTCSDIKSRLEHATVYNRETMEVES